MPIGAIQRARLDVLTLGGHDGSKELRCHRRDDSTSSVSSAHIGASERTCAQVHSYKYTSPPSTTFEKLFLERWWTYVVERWCPLWVAPNALTFGGLFFVIITYAMIWSLSPALAHDAPTWAYVLSAVFMFTYQTADGIDGKQARRTKSGSPLGEVVDHGCDAVCTCVYGMMFVDMLSVGFATPSARRTAIAMMTASRIFFSVDTVSSTYTGRLPVNTTFDVQEMQVCLQITTIVFGFIGNEVLNTYPVSIPYLGERGVGQLVVDAGMVFGTLSRMGTFWGTVTSKEVPPHWPKHRSPSRIAAFCVVSEIFNGVCLYYAPNLALAHATNMLLFAEAEMSIMRLRVSDPDWPLFNWLSVLIMAMTTMVPAGDMFTGGVLLGTALFLLIHRSATLASQVTGCLGMHPNIFILPPSAKKD